MSAEVHSFVHTAFLMRLPWYAPAAHGNVYDVEHVSMLSGSHQASTLQTAVGITALLTECQQDSEVVLSHRCLKGACCFLYRTHGIHTKASLTTDIDILGHLQLSQAIFLQPPSLSSCSLDTPAAAKDSWAPLHGLGFSLGSSKVHRFTLTSTCRQRILVLDAKSMLQLAA